ncbi:MAG: branched-chain amino acid ABC transporter permease [Nitrososphaerota archaeon]
MLPPFALSSVVYASLFGLMALGLTLTYITTKVPNFSYGSLVTVGAYTAYTLFRLRGLNPYQSIPITFIMGGVVSVALYLLVLRPLARRGASLLSLMIATLALDIAFVGIFGIYTDILQLSWGLFDAKYFFQLRADFQLLGLPGVFFASPAALVAISGFLYFLLNRTRFGVAMRAAIENPSLSKVLGINVERMYLFAWFLAGGFGALAGSFYVLWLPGSINTGSVIIVDIFASSILGGLSSIFGALIGGVIVGASEILLTTAAINLLGSWVAIYQTAIPLAIMIATLMIVPNGLVSVNWRRMLHLAMR